jgi:hypothetical protein
MRRSGEIGGFHYFYCVLKFMFGRSGKESGFFLLITNWLHEEQDEHGHGKWELYSFS